jgi:DNA-binding NarL/FixJ family response regulator
MKFLLVDDHALIREALHTVLKQLKRDTVILEASNSRQAMRTVEEHPDLDLILLDINLPDRDGFSVLGELRERYATIAIIVLSAVDDQDTVKRAFKLGALGFIPKTTERDVMLNAIRMSSRFFATGARSRNRQSWAQEPRHRVWKYRGGN